MGIIYSSSEKMDERKTYTLEQLNEITAVAKDFSFFVQEKWKIATDRPGSGNTKNIGSITNIEDLIMVMDLLLQWMKGYLTIIGCTI